MADNREERSREAGNRNRAQRLAAQRLQRHQEFWGVPDDDRGRAHRRNRAQRTRRSR
jgi:hypothetical protein